MIHARKATINDLPEIVAIYNSIIPLGTITADTHPVTVESRIEWFHAHTNQRPIYVLYDLENLIGFLSFKSFYGRPAYNITAEVSIYLNQEFRGKGYGKEILLFGIHKSKELGIENLLAFIFNTNQNSIKLFEAFGFKPWAHLPRVAKMPDGYRDLIILGLNVVSSHLPISKVQEQELM